MIRFQHSEYLYALAVIPLFILLFLWSRAKRRTLLAALGETHLLSQLFPDVSAVKPAWRTVLFTLGYAFLVVGMANPQLGTKLEEVKREGVNIMLALDVSNSMRAEDLKPNRLERAKQAISRMTDKLSNDRVGLIVFAGEAYLQLPLTNDYGAVKMFLSAIDPNMIPTQGTNIGAAVKTALESFNADEKRYKTLVILTDGENHEDDALKAIKDAHDAGVITHTIGMGTPEGTPIPVYAMGFQTGFRKDRSGSVILTKLNEQSLQQLASAGGGVYVRANNTETGLNIVLEEIGKMEKKEFGTKVFTNFEDRFQYLLAIALLFLLWEVFLSDLRTGWWRSLNLFGHAVVKPSSVLPSSSPVQSIPPLKRQPKAAKNPIT
jgi:Ca-activated chloride channel homolog